MQSDHSDLQGVRVLVVEDDEASRDIVELILAHYWAAVKAVG
jgi:hypothetical protein